MGSLGPKQHSERDEISFAASNVLFPFRNKQPTGLQSRLDPNFETWRRKYSYLDNGTLFHLFENGIVVVGCSKEDRLNSGNV